MFFVKSVRISPGALAALKAAGTFGVEFVDRHHRGDWGEVEEEDIQQNERGLAGEAVAMLSAFSLPRTGQILWVITAADRSYTQMLLPEEY